MDQQRALFATTVRNASTHQCIFTPMSGLEFAYQDGTLYRVTANASSFQRGYTEALLRVEELPGMSDEEIWKRVMGG